MIKARPLSVFGSKVRIELEDRRQMNVDKSIFTKEGSDYLVDWAISELGKSGKLLKLNVTKREEMVKEYTEDVKLTDGTTAKDAMEIEEFEGYYDLIMENESDFPINGMLVEYRTFSEQDKVAAKGRDEVLIKSEAGSLTVDLLPGDETRKSTDVIKMRETNMGQGISYTGGGDTASKAKMIGIWTKFYYKGQLIMEYALPRDIPKRYEWDSKP
jgi:hypothetical protein